MSTFTATLSPLEQAGLRTALNAGAFEFRTLAHALFSAKGEGVTCTVYNSGKCVVQGKGADQFVEHHLAAHQRADDAAEEDLRFSVTCVGSDESGKGDYFGPLVVAAVVMGPEDLPAFEGHSIKDSKKLTTKGMRATAALIRETLASEVVVLMPEKYNELYEDIGNLNKLLAWAHGAALEGALEKRDAERVVIDQFCRREQLVSRLKPKTLSKELEIRPRAESNPACAAASILAATTFDRKLRDLSEVAQLTLPKGAGRPVDLAARRLVGNRGTGILKKVAKVHFANTRKL